MFSEGLDGLPIMNENKEKLLGALIKKDVIRYLAKQRGKHPE